MFTCTRTDSTNTDFKMLVNQLDRYLMGINGDDHDFFDQFNKIDNIRHVVVLYLDGQPAGCGAIKEYAADTMEVKRMYVPLHRRGQGIASLILEELEKWCRELNYNKCILETGIRQPEAIRLYEKNGYTRIPNYGQYANMDNSVCFEKKLG